MGGQELPLQTDSLSPGCEKQTYQRENKDFFFISISYAPTIFLPQTKIQNFAGKKSSVEKALDSLRSRQKIMDLVWLWFSTSAWFYGQSFKTRPVKELGINMQYLLYSTVDNSIFFCRLGGRASSDHRQKDIQGIINFAFKLFIFIAGIFWLAVTQKDSGRYYSYLSFFIAHNIAPPQPLIIWFCFYIFSRICLLFWRLAFVYVQCVPEKKSRCIWEV